MSDSGNVVRLPDFGAIDAEAAAWIARLDSGSATSDDRAGFIAWKAQSHHHQEAADRLGGLLSDLDVLGRLATPSAPAASRRRPAAGGALGARRLPRTVAGLVAIAASIAAAVGLAFIGSSQLAPATQVYGTAIGAQRTVNLADGSSVQLNTNSRLEVRYTRKARDLHLVSGEAYFDVAPNKRRPFSVYTRDGVVRAVGTAFVVRLRGQRVDVTVTKGTVELASFTRPPPVLWLDRAAGLERRSRAMVSATPGVVESAVIAQDVVSKADVPAPEATRRLAWRQGMLVFAGEPLPEVIADVGRYTDVEIEIVDPSLRSVKMAGYFKVGEIDPMLEALETGFGVRVERVDAKHVKLFAAS
jgi:transmembrane sensor